MSKSKGYWTTTAPNEPGYYWIRNHTYTDYPIVAWLEWVEIGGFPGLCGPRTHLRAFVAGSECSAEGMRCEWWSERVEAPTGVLKRSPR